MKRFAASMMSQPPSQETYPDVLAVDFCGEQKNGLEGQLSRAGSPACCAGASTHFLLHDADRRLPGEAGLMIRYGTVGAAAPAAAATSIAAVPAIATIALGLLLLFCVGFLQVSAVHNGAHDTRHANGLPCH